MKQRIWGATCIVCSTLLVAIGTILFASVVSVSDELTDETLRCGSAFHRDNKAARTYEAHRAVQALKALAEDAPSDLGAIGRDHPEDLDVKCKETLALLQGWSTAFWVAAVAFLIAGVVIWRWDSESASKARNAAGQIIEGARFPKWMRHCQDWVIAVLTLIGSFTGLFTSTFEGAWRVAWFFVTAAFLLTAASIAIARDSERRRQERWIIDAEESHRKSRRALLGDQLLNLLHLVSEAVSAGEVAERKMLAQSARVAILAAAANLVGQKAEHGTRANLFKWDEEREVIELAPMGFSGRGERSERVFRPGDDTYEATMNRKGTFVEDVNEDADNEGATLGYETYCTYPVHVPNRIHGVLTVDCLHKGELVKADDVPMMSVLARLIAITYECEKYPRART